jgi:hypothetical protein
VLNRRGPSVFETLKTLVTMAFPFFPSSSIQLREIIHHFTFNISTSSTAHTRQPSLYTPTHNTTRITLATMPKAVPAKKSKTTSYHVSTKLATMRWTVRARRVCHCKLRSSHFDDHGSMTDHLHHHFRQLVTPPLVLLLQKFLSKTIADLKERKPNLEGKDRRDEAIALWKKTDE